MRQLRVNVIVPVTIYCEHNVDSPSNACVASVCHVQSSPKDAKFQLTLGNTLNIQPSLNSS